MRVGYFGGSFDPPHRGHLNVALAAQQRFALDAVWLAPTGRQPLKPAGPSASFDDRLAMTTLLCEGVPGLRASAIDAPRPDGTANYTADTLAKLRSELPAEAKLFAIVGADAFAGLPKWRQMSELFTQAEWIVVSRPGSELPDLRAMALTPQQCARVHFLSGISDPTSATALREQIQAHSCCDDLLPKDLCKYIEAHRLYRGR